MKFINLTRHTEIGANSYYLEAGGARLILDCGMHPKDAGDNALRRSSYQSRASGSHRNAPGIDAMPAPCAHFHDGRDQRNRLSSSP